MPTDNNIALRDASTGVLVVVYYMRGTYPLRESVRSHTFCFAKYGRHKTLYVNAAYPVSPLLFRGINVVGIVFDNTFLGTRWLPSAFSYFSKRVQFMKHMTCTKIVLPQDEFINTDLLCDFIVEMGVTHIGSNADPGDWKKIYRKLPPGHPVQFHKILTGYVDQEHVQRLGRIVASHAGKPRDIDIAYRASNAPFWLGSQGRHKVEIASAAVEAATALGLRCHISLNSDDVIYGIDWYLFLLKAKAVIGCEGGSSVCDHDGSLKDQVEQYIRQHPGATFQEIKDTILKDRDGEIALHNVTPRHFECALTHTYQILVEGSYEGVMQAGVHYYPVKRDYSNFQEALETIDNASIRDQIVANAHAHLIASGIYGYDKFTAEVESWLGGVETEHSPAAWTTGYLYISKLYSAAVWAWFVAEAFFVKMAQKNGVTNKLFFAVKTNYRRKAYGVD